MRRKRKILANFRVMALANGPIKEQVKGTKKGKRGYNRKDKTWRNET